MDTTKLPVAVIGAGPVGLAAAVHLLERNETPLVLEAGAAVGASMLAWGHVRLFTPWKYATDKAATARLEAIGWEHPNAEEHPTGADLVNLYLRPLASLPELRDTIHVNSKVTAIARAGFDKMKTTGREQAPFILTVTTEDGDEVQYLAKAVIDASGTYSKPNPLGANGTPALGEAKAANQIFYGIPNVLGQDRERYANKTVLVAGSGASAFNVLLDLTKLTQQAPETKVIWVIRRPLTGRVFGGGEADELPERGSLGQRVRDFVEQGKFQIAAEFKTTKIRQVGTQLEVSSDTQTLAPVDEIIVTTGFRPDMSLFSELRVSLDAAVESPVALASMIDPNFHSCGTVQPHGAEELKQPEPDFYIVGSKSYGRAPTFLLLTGYEQARSVAAAVAGDWDAARQVQLVLPETGVCCSTPDDSVGISCCGTASPVQQSAVIQLIDISTPQAASCCGTPVAVAEQGTQVTSGSCCG